MIFDKKYRDTLVKDGASRYLYAGKLVQSLQSLRFSSTGERIQTYLGRTGRSQIRYLGSCLSSMSPMVLDGSSRHDRRISPSMC
jgi:hypothetical protein